MSWKYLQFPCGCKLPIVSEGENRPYVKITFDTNQEFDCKATWDLIGRGDTKGVFQLDSNLGQMSSKRLKPTTIEELGALTAIVRPGCKESIIDGKSVTDHYIDRKNREEEVTYQHPALESALKKTYGELIYQEQAMQIARDVAGFNLQEADMLRKAIGKKKADEMAKCKKMFLEGAKKAGILTDEQAEEIFAGIEKSQRYSFNKSHAISYAIVAYWSAYAKAHLHEQFFTSHLRHSQNEADQSQEISEVVNNAKLSNVEVSLPDLRRNNKHFKLFDKIYFGIIDIKGIGESVYEKICETKNKIDKPVEQWTKLDFLLRFAPEIGVSNAEILVSCGAVSYIDNNRTLMLYELKQVGELTDKEREYIINNLMQPITVSNENATNKGCLNLIDILDIILKLPVGRKGAIANKNRHQKIQGMYNALLSPAYKLEDDAAWIAKEERRLLGIPITCSEVDSCDTSLANCSCKDFINGYVKHPIIAAKLERVREITIKKGKSIGEKMAFATISDNSCLLDSVTIFSEPYKKFKHLLIEGNNIMISGKKDNKRGGLIVDKIWQLY